MATKRKTKKAKRGTALTSRVKKTVTKAASKVRSLIAKKNGAGSAPRKPAARKTAPKRNPSRDEIKAAVEKVYGRKISDAELRRAIGAARAVRDIPKKRDIKIVHYRAKKNPASLAGDLIESAYDIDAKAKQAAAMKRAPRKPKSNPAMARTIKMSDILISNGEQSLKDSLGRIKKGFRPKSKGPIMVSETAGGKYIINDGFHRTAVELLKGRKTIKAKVRRLPKKNPGLIGVIAEAAVGIDALINIGEKIEQNDAREKRARAAKVVQRKPARPAPAKKSAKKNPGTAAEAKEMFEEFTGRESTKVQQIYAPDGTPGNTSEEGVLEALIMADGRVFQFDRPTTGKTYYLVGAKTSERPDGQLYITGAPFGAPKDLSLAKGETRSIGTISSVVYRQQKVHLDDGPDTKPTDYKHRFNAPRPVLGVDRDGNGHFVGGGYQIRPEGIVD